MLVEAFIVLPPCVPLLRSSPETTFPYRPLTYVSYDLIGRGEGAPSNGALPPL